jgi:hypothetical protein
MQARGAGREVGNDHVGLARDRGGCRRGTATIGDAADVCPDES